MSRLPASDFNDSKTWNGIMGTTSGVVGNGMYRSFYPTNMNGPLGFPAGGLPNNNQFPVAANAIIQRPSANGNDLMFSKKA